MRPERRIKPGMDGGLTAAGWVRPPHHLRTGKTLSKRWGPPQKFSALRNPNERWLMDLILLFMPSTAPLETRCLVHDRIPSRWVRSMRTNFLKGSNRDLIAECIHFSRWSFARLGCL